MFPRILIAFVSWVWGFLGWLGGGVVAGIVGLVLFVASPTVFDKTVVVLLVLLGSGLGRVVASAVLHSIGTLMLPVETRGKAWLRGLAIACASRGALDALLHIQFDPGPTVRAILAPAATLAELEQVAVLAVWAMTVAVSTLAGLAVDLHTARTLDRQETLRKRPSPASQPAGQNAIAAA